MKAISILLTIFALLGLPLEVAVRAQVHVRGYTKKDGTYVAPHYRSAPDRNFNNNWSTKGNVNPYTGAVGTRETPPQYPSYRSGDPASGTLGMPGNPGAGMNRAPDYSTIPNATIGNPAGLPTRQNVRAPGVYIDPVYSGGASEAKKTPAPVARPTLRESATAIPFQSAPVRQRQSDGINFNRSPNAGVTQSIGNDFSIVPEQTDSPRPASKAYNSPAPSSVTSRSISGVNIVNGSASTFHIPQATETFEDRLRARGVTDNLSGKSYGELDLMERRINTAATLKNKFGVEVDWQTKSNRELNEMLTEAETRKSKSER